MKQFTVYGAIAILCLYFNKEIDIIIDSHCYSMVLFINSIYWLFCILLQCINKNDNWLMLFPTVLLNSVILVIFSLWYLDNMIDTEYSIIRKVACIPSFIVLYDIIFYFGHRALHTKYLYSFHKKHHSVYADTAISGYYMSVLDFIIEVIAPFFLTQYLLGNDKTIIVMYSILGQINTALSHGGYKLPLFPYGDEHYIHHIKQKNNYGFLFTDYIFDTKYLK